MKKFITAFLLILVVFTVSLNFVYATEEGTGNQTSSGESETIYGIDFSNAKLKIESSTRTTYDIVFNDVKYDSDSTHNGALSYIITSTNSKPTYDSNIAKRVDKEQTTNTATIYEFEQWFELKQDIYLWIFEVPYTDNATPKLVYNSKIEKPELKQYTDLYFATMIDYSRNQILFNMPWHKETKRNITIKVGEIKDDSLLLSIKNKESNAFQKLLDYGKKGTNAVLNQTVTSTNYTAGYDTDTTFNLYDKISDNSYYYLYTYIDDGNGKYTPVEGITLAQANKFTNAEKSWFLHFYGEENFKWKEFAANQPTQAPQPVDNTVAPNPLPNTGISKIVYSLMAILIIFVVVIISKNNKYKNID